MSPRRPDAIALEIGAPIPPLERVLTQMRLVAYGAATWDWHRLHYEPEYAAARNIPGPIVDGQMFGATDQLPSIGSGRVRSSGG